jgi:hypothetical protein
VNYPGRTTFMKVPTLSTIWDYINRAMPWNAPKSLTTDDVYSVVAFLLNLNGIVPDDFTLSDKNIREVQGRMPNRNGMTTKHAMWPGNEFGGTAKPDTSNVACMKDCVPEVKLASFLPEFARNAHGNLAEQNRAVGAQHGADTTRPEAKVGAPALVAAPAAPKAEAPSGAKAALGPVAEVWLHRLPWCEQQDRRVRPSRMLPRSTPARPTILAGRSSPAVRDLGCSPMPPQTLSDAEAKTIAAWLASGAGK